MGRSSFTFRDFGLVPEHLSPPAGPIRSFFSPARVFGQYAFTGIVASIGLALATLFALEMAAPLNVLAPAATAVGFAAVLFLATHNDYRWVELVGDTLRARHLYANYTIERPIEEIDSLGTIVLAVRRIETAIVERLLGRVKGIEIRFRDGRTPLRVMRADPAMTNAQELIEGVIYQMAQFGELDTEIVDFVGKPLVRTIHWKGREPRTPPRKDLKVILLCVALLGLMFGTILGFWGTQEDRRRHLGLVPPQQISVQTLAANGPGENRHVTLTGFRPGGYTAEGEDGAWTQVWVALFPTGSTSDVRREIRVVLSSSAVHDEAALRELLRSGRVSGICTRSPTKHWGAELGPNLRKANPGCELASAWAVEEMREPPPADRVKQLLTGSEASFATALVAAIIVFLKR